MTLLKLIALGFIAGFIATLIFHRERLGDDYAYSVMA